MNAMSAYHQGLKWANELLEMVMADVTNEQARDIPPGIANPLGAVYAHAVFGEDYQVQVFLKGGHPLYETAFAGKTGAANPPQLAMELEWARTLNLDLQQFRPYAQAVYRASYDAITLLDDGGLDRTIDMTAFGFGKVTVGWMLNALILSHVNNMAGEASALKGVQGLKGYPF